MVRFSGPPASAIRNKPITEELKGILEAAALEVGVDHVRITSGGQPGTTGRRTGSTRHDGGRAADLQLVINGRTQTFSDSSGGPVFEGFVSAAAARGANGIGAGVNYMGNRTIHVGFGVSPSDDREIAWGAKGRSVNAPAWLKRAAEEGWDNPASAGGGVRIPGNMQLEHRYVVIARGGLHLRKGPGSQFGITTTLPAGSEVTVLAWDGALDDWARVDLEDDGLVDGHLFGAYLTPVDTAEVNNEEVEEPGEDDTG